MTSNLNFHPFQDGFSINSNNGGFSGSIGERDKNSLVNDGEAMTNGSTKNFFSLSFYQQYFDVDTDQVVKRVINSVVPTHNNFILDFVQPLPDLWGPFWISVTLVFSIGVFGNIAQFISSDGTAKDIVGSDFRLVTSATSLVFCYVLLVPLLVYAVLWQRKSDLQYPYLDIVCAYGYSLAIFIPVSVLWVLNFNVLRWILIFAAVTLSGGVLAKAIYPAFKNDSNKLVAFGSIASVLLLHFLLAFCFKVYFFDAAHPLQPEAITEAASQVLPQLPDINATGAKVSTADVSPKSTATGVGENGAGTTKSLISTATVNITQKILENTTTQPLGTGNKTSEVELLSTEPSTNATRVDEKENNAAAKTEATKKDAAADAKNDTAADGKNGNTSSKQS